MSYRATICYKKIKAIDVFSFLVKFKEEIKNNMEEIGKNQFLYAPTSRYPHKFKDTDLWERLDANVDWANNYIFKYRWFYIPESELLGIFGVDDCVHHLFDNISYFQNSCDQDYEYELWHGIPEFESIANKWRDTDDESMKDYCKSEYGRIFDESDYCNLDYYRRSAAYKEIWTKYGEDYLECEDKVVYLTLFGSYETHVLRRFAKVCEERYQNWEQKFEKKQVQKGENNA